MSRYRESLRPVLLFIAALGLAPLGASSAFADGPADLIPEGSLIGIGWSGADAVEPAFLQTGLGQIAAEPRIQEMCDALMPALESFVQRELPSPEQREAMLAVREVLGEIWAHPLAISVTGLELIGGQPVPQVAICLRAGDGAERLFRSLDSIREREGVPAEPYPGAASARRVALPDAPVPLVYGVERGCFFIALTEGATDATLATIRGDAPSIASSSGFSSAWRRVVADSEPMKWLYLDGAGLHQHALHLLRDSEAAVPLPVQALLGENGLGRLGPVMLAVGMEGEGFRRSTYVGWRSDSAPGAPIDLSDLVVVPKDTSFFSYEDCDIAGLIVGLRDFVASTDPEVSRQLRGFQALADGFLGFRVEEEFLASVGRRFLVFEEPTASGIVPGLCLVLTPNDGEKIQDCVERLTISAGALAGIAGVRVGVREKRGITFIESSGAPVPIAPAWATRGERLFLALHPTVLEEVLHRVDAPDARSRSILANEDFVAATKRIGSDQHGYFYTDTPEVIGELYPLILPLLQTGMAAIGGEVSGLSASQLPPPYMVNERMFGDIHGYRRTGDGWLWEAHGPLPFTLPDVGSMVMLGVLGGVVPSLSVARQRAVHVQEMAETVAIDRPTDDHALLTIRLEQASLIGEACREYAQKYNGVHPTTLGKLAKDGAFPAEFLNVNGEELYVYGGALAPSGDTDRVLFHSAGAVIHGQYLLVTVTGSIEIVDKDELDRRVRASNWPGRRVRF